MTNVLYQRKHLYMSGSNSYIEALGPDSCKV